MQVIGICGGIGSGKSATSLEFLRHGIPVLNADNIYHELTASSSPCLDELILRFGHDIIIDGALDRNKLSSIIFSSAESRILLDELNSITHKHVLKEMDCQIKALEEQGHAIVAVEAPLLFESGFDKRCDIVIAVIADKNVRIERIISRDSITRDKAIAMIDAQLSDEFLVANADYVVNNDLGLDNIEYQIDKILKEII